MVVKFAGHAKALYLRHKTLVDYVFFGGLTTAVNYAVYFSLTRLVAMNYMAANAIAWVAAVAFAFVVNKKYVFNSQATGLVPVLREVLLFVAARFSSLGIESGLLYLLVGLARLNDAIVKVVVGFVVVLANYAFSKLIVFRKGMRSE
jgi:putative flippase GtrA